MTSNQIFLLCKSNQTTIPLHDQALIKSFFENLSSLQAILEKKFSRSGAAIEYFEAMIRDLALKVEDDIEIQLSNFLLAKDEAASLHELRQTFQKAEEKTAMLVEIIINKEKETCEHYDDLTYLMGIIDHHIEPMQSNARVFYNKTPFKSLNENLSSLLELFFLTWNFRAAAIKDLETKTLKVADDIVYTNIVLTIM